MKENQCFPLSFNLYPYTIIKIQYSYAYKKQIAETFLATDTLASLE